MPNMGYCRFTNTLRDLYDCREALETGDGDDDELDGQELRAKKQLIVVCREIAEDYGEW